MAGESRSWLNEVLAAAFSGLWIGLAVVMGFLCGEWGCKVAAIGLQWGCKVPLSFFRVRWLMSGA
jgi:hypothetical protein